MVERTSRYLVGLADGRVLSNPLGGSMVLKLADADTRGAYSVHLNEIPAGAAGPRPHRHLRHEEIFCVLGGTLTVRIDDEHISAPTGSFVVVPRGALHQPMNLTATPVQVLLMFSPGGMDGSFIEAAERRLPLASNPPSIEVASALEAFTERYGYEFGSFSPGG